MTRRELEKLTGVLITGKMEMVMGPDGLLYGRLSDGSWEPYPDKPRPDVEETAGSSRA